MASVSWQYPQDQLIALRRQNAAAVAAQPVAAGVDISALNFRYEIEGDTPAWRPLRAFDDGSKVYIEFPSGIRQGEMPPLFVIGPGGDSELVNYRARQNYYVVDRLFAAAELRLGDRNSERRVRIVRTDGRRAAMTDGTQREPAVTPDLRLRAERPRVTRLSRKVLIGLGGASSLAVAAALIYALQTRNARSGRQGAVLDREPHHGRRT